MDGQLISQHRRLRTKDECPEESGYDELNVPYVLKLGIDYNEVMLFMCQKQIVYEKQSAINM